MRKNFILLLTICIFSSFKIKDYAITQKTEPVNKVIDYKTEITKTVITDTVIVNKVVDNQTETPKTINTKSNVENKVIDNLEETTNTTSTESKKNEDGNTDYKLIISIFAILISLTSLGWNIYNKFNSEKKKLLIQCFKSKNHSNDNFQCVVTLTNIGNKPIFIRRIELEEKVNGKARKRDLDFEKFRQSFENTPLQPENWKTLIFEDTKYFKFFNTENQKFKKTRIKIIDPTGKIYSTEWFTQNNLR